MTRKQIIPSIILLLLAVAVIAGISLAKDYVIIQTGILFYRKLRLFLFIIAGALLAIAILSMILSVRKQSRLNRQEGEESPAGNPSQAANLSVSSGLDAVKIQALLQEKLEGEWRVCGNEINSCLEQMKTMDRYQDKLNRLLKENGADSLNDTEEILERVEQYLCKNVRKVLNYMNVADTGDADDQEMIRNKLNHCQAANAVQLDQTQQFLFALTEFLNRQGDEDTGTDMLEMYRQTILDSLNLEN